MVAICRSCSSPRRRTGRYSPPPRPPLVLSGHAASLTRTNRTRRVPHPVLIEHAASLTPYRQPHAPARREPKKGCSSLESRSDVVELGEEVLPPPSY